MLPIDSVVTGLTVEFGKKLMSKLFKLADDKFSFTLAVKGFSLNNWNDEEDSQALLALVEVTNLNEEPYNISGFFLSNDQVSVPNVYIDRVENKTVQGRLLDVVTGNKLRAYFEVDFDFFEPLWRPYLLKNQSASGVIAFRLPKEISHSSTLSIGVQMAGFDRIIKADIL